MINQNLHSKPAALDSNAHRQLKLQLPVTDWSLASRLNALFVAATEFGDTCREYPVVFVRAGKDADGKDAVAPIAVFGVSQNENLFVEKGQWRARYLPAVLRLYPFCIARVDEQRYAVCLDLGFAGVSETQGTPLWTAEGQPSELTVTMQKQLEVMEGEIQRTRAICQRLQELDLLRDMRFDATLPDGRQHSVDGFLTIDEKKVGELPDDVVLELHRSGILGLIHLHWVSLGNMRQLLDWFAQRLPPAPAPIPVPAMAMHTQAGNA